MTWSNQPPYTAANNVLGVGLAAAYYEWNVTSLVQTWVNGAANHGLALVSKNESTIGWRGFASREQRATQSAAAGGHLPPVKLTRW
ncbi:MAG: DNRLRE domain-containing protein [Anaerolineae bacterium]|nr:MAG: DNRLRE domain-containing protein [Anaerolineae bacterium]